MMMLRQSDARARFAQETRVETTIFKTAVRPLVSLALEHLESI
jgi:hypothetical protein